MVKMLLPLLALLVGLFACTNNDKTEVALEDDNALYHHYLVTAEEGLDDVHVRLQFLAGGPEGDAEKLKEPSTVLLDGEPLAADSTRFMGAYYELSKPLETFAGDHTITFRNGRKKEVQTSFRFFPFTLANELPESIPKKPFTIALTNLPNEAVKLRLVITDTSMTSARANLSSAGGPAISLSTVTRTIFSLVIATSSRVGLLVTSSPLLMMAMRSHNCSASSR